MFKRSYFELNSLNRSFFLWGQRKSGKTTLLRDQFPEAHWVDLLKSDEFVKFQTSPQLLREELLAKPETHWVVIDEIQKVPALLDEVHWLIENTPLCFALSGSSARKLKRGHANLLGGRALRFELYGLSWSELQEDFDLNRILNAGYLPDHYLNLDQPRLLQSYIQDYLKEEIAAEALVKNLTPFSDFLNLSALSDTEKLSYTTFAREVGVSSHTIKEYFQILNDTLLGFWLPAYTNKPKRRISKVPKFYFSDVGVVNALAKRHSLEAGSAEFGKAFENWIAHEIRCYNQYQDRFADLHYWSLTSGAEVDFIVGDMQVAIESKCTQLVKTPHLKGLRVLAEEQNVGRKIIVSMDPQKRITDDKIEIYPYDLFCEELWSGQIF